MLRDIRQDILDLPRALRETLEKCGAEYEKVVRETHWGEGPIHIIGSGAPLVAGLAAAYAFESLVGWPGIARSAAEFEAYSLSALRPRSIVLAISQFGESPQTVGAARAAKSHGATVLALTSDTQSELAKLADGVFPVHAAEEHAGSLKFAACQQAAACYLGFVVARCLKRPNPHLATLEEDFKKLPERLEWALAQLSDAIQTFASKLKGGERVFAVGGGFYYPAAMHSVAVLKRLGGIDARALSAAEFEQELAGMRERGDAVVFLTGSRSRVKRIIHRLAEGARNAGAQVLSLSDGNDPELSRCSDLVVLLPIMSEEVGAILTLALLDWVAYYTGRVGRPERSRARASRPYS